MPVIDQQITIEIDEQKVLKDIGYELTAKPANRINSLVADYIENADTLFDPSYSYVIRDIDLVYGNHAFIESGIIFKSKVLACLMERYDRIAIFAVTIGNHLEEMVAYLAENDLVLQATVLDAIGSGAAEQLAVFAEDKIRNIASSLGLSISRRFSPGYCDWDIDQQEMIFRALGDNSSGIRLTEEYLMLPRKSISGIIGIGTQSSNIENYNPCKTCLKQDCPGRRE